MHVIIRSVNAFTDLRVFDLRVDAIVASVYVTER